MKCNKTPKATNTNADAQTPTNTLCAVIEMVRTEAVGPETHINCIDDSGKLERKRVNQVTNGRRIVGSSLKK
jgi:hypothetical protein